MDSNPFRVCLGVYAGRGGLEKKGESGRNRGFWEGRVWEFDFSS